LTSKAFGTSLRSNISPSSKLTLSLRVGEQSCSPEKLHNTMGFLSNWKRAKETEYFVGNLEDALRRYDPQWPDLSASHTRKAVKHLLTIQKINAVDAITAVGWAGIAGIVSDLKGLYDRDGHADLSQNCQFILDCCRRYLGQT
jgi:hypothetical protein